MLSQLNPFIAAEITHRREHLLATAARSRSYAAETPTRRPRDRHHLVPRLVRRAFAAH